MIQFDVRYIFQMGLKPSTGLAFKFKKLIHLGQLSNRGDLKEPGLSCHPSLVLAGSGVHHCSVLLPDTDQEGWKVSV